MNLQGDIVAVYNASGTKLVSYAYDAWGNVTTTYSNGGASTAAQYNPFRYRGYYYDTETGWYYLQSRYYNPTWGRFINADTIDVLSISPMSLTDKNLFAYCDNNPITRADDGGELWHILAGAAIGGLIGGISSIVGQVISGQKINWAEVGVSVASGAVSGAINAAIPGMGTVATGLVQGVVGATTYAATELVNGRTPTVTGTLAAGVTSGVLAVGARAIGKVISKNTKVVNAGSPFKGTGSGQIGVDPNTLTLNPNFTPNPQKYQAALYKIKTSGMYGVVEVTRKGLVIDGQHRVLIGRALGLAVDVVIR